MARFFLFLLTVFNSLCICANVTADDKLAMNIGGNLNVESKQDTDYAKGNNWGVNAGVGNTGSASGGFNVGSSNHDSAWVNDVTELRGGDVDINVGGKTTVTGAVIAAGEDGDLNLATNELEYKDLHDFNTSNERGFGVNTGIGISTDKGETNLHPQGSTTISATHTGSATEQTTHATIGAGNITVGGDPNPELAGLNRDTDKVQEITKDEITGSLDSSVTVDNRIFSESGREQIAEQHENFVDNAEQAVKDSWNLPNTTLGALWGLAGMTISDNVTHYYDEENRIHIFSNNPLGVYGSAGTLGNVINFMSGAGDPDRIIDSYKYSEANKTGAYLQLNYDDERVHFLSHELKHRDQGQYLGPLFLPVYGISGGASSTNWMEKQADKAGHQFYLNKIKE